MLVIKYILVNAKIIFTAKYSNNFQYLFCYGKSIANKNLKLRMCASKEDWTIKSFAIRMY